jgi:hypothetical protein
MIYLELLKRKINSTQKPLHSMKELGNSLIETRLISDTNSQHAISIIKTQRKLSVYVMK